MIKTLCLSALTAALLVAAPAHSQSRRELAERLDAVEARIAEVETSSMAGDPVAETLLRRLDELDYQMRELTSETERLTFENRQLRSQVEALQAQLDRGGRTPRGYDGMDGGPDAAGAGGVDRGDLDEDAVAWMSEGLDEAGQSGRDIAVVDPDDPYAEARAEATGVLGAPSRRPAGEPSSDTRAPAARDPETLYGDARDKLLEGDFGGAQVDFEQFVNAYPDHARTGEAWYWLGETFFVRSDFTGAADAYIAALRAEPNGDKAPDALVRLAASLNGMGRQADACGTLERFDSQFPNASAASRARASREAVRAGC
ncbi:tol-pal system protein YbgF [Maricaulis sp.]|uniref:tol-pal system protein YbgF n=1 Tax=Maricaulis sp. TaxID=1486257 RepID=UPI001B11DC8B|nr:tol-pal system protein YbgF [Maricaulis sp.]MBO6764593.1 tol-pal system protein YbgF [Maricaulis sp.]